MARRRRKKKKKNLNKTLANHVLEMAGNLVCRLPFHVGSSVANLIPIGLGITELPMSEIMFSFFLSIYSQCGALASQAARHTTVCLDTIKILWQH